MFELTKGEFVDLRSQIVTSSSPQWGGPRYRPMAFTEQGIAIQFLKSCEKRSVLRSRKVVPFMANVPVRNQHETVNKF